ncbi:MAG: YMGG-like glycine zipper-containing protein [Sphingobacteriales bacterium]
MKKILSVLAIVVVFTACKNNKDNGIDQTKILSASDAAQYNEFQQFQEWKKQKEMENDRAAGNTVNESTASNTKTVVHKTKPVYRTSAPTTSTATTRKKGWSKAAKGTVIGAGAGAVAGAIINKRNRAVGAVIGGILGGGVGYGIGRSMDKKDGRY